MAKSEFKQTADFLAKKYGSKEKAIIYCEGRIDHAEFIIEDLEENGSYAILSDWEDEFKDGGRYYKKVKAILQGKTEKQFDQEEDEEEEFEEED
jgi:hypothetical protein